MATWDGQEVLRINDLVMHAEYVTGPAATGWCRSLSLRLRRVQAKSRHVGFRHETGTIPSRRAAVSHMFNNRRWVVVDSVIGDCGW